MPSTLPIPRFLAPVGRPRRARAVRAVFLGTAALWLSACSGKGVSLDAPADDDLSDRQRRQLQVFDSTVRNPSPDIDPEIRRQAAEELMAMDAPAATAILADAMRSGEAPVSLAVIEAMESSPRLVPGLLEPSVDTLQVSSDESREKLAMILPRYGRPALDLVAHRARDAQYPPELRIGPIYALSAFKNNRESAFQLMMLLDADEPAPPEIADAACQSLERLTGLPYKSDAEQWRQWWSKLKDKPIEDWLRIVVEHLSERNTEIEQQFRSQQRANEAIAARLAETYRELFLSLPVEEQQRRLPDLLRDDLAPVRKFAVGRVERMLRDSERVPEAVQVRLAERLGNRDELPALRLACARLLNDLNHPTRALIIDALAQEQDETIARGYLELLAKRPEAMSPQAILAWLAKPVTGPAAADALWALVVAGALTQEQVEETRAAAAEAFAALRTPSHARLLAAIGGPGDREAVVALLDSGQPELRRAAAAGLAWAGVSAPLLSHAADPEIYPFAIDVVARGAADLAALGTLASLAPVNNHRQAWAQAVLRVAAQLPPADLLAADDALRAQPHVPPDLRAAALARAADLPPEALAPERRTELLVRLIELQITSNEYQRAFETSQRLAGAPSTTALAHLKFKAAVLAGHFEEAAGLSGAVRVWVDAYEKLVNEHPRAAAALGREIERRFTLDEATRTIFETARQRLPQDAVTDGTDDKKRTE